MSTRARRTRCLVGLGVLIGALASALPAAAQYIYNPANADEGPGIRYFGSAKDERGVLLTGVSVLISSGQLSFLMVTDDEGRFRTNLPLDMLPDKVSAKCFKAGYQLTQISKRQGPTGPKVTVQVDCILRASHADNREPDRSNELESLRHANDYPAQRRHAWTLLARMTTPHAHKPAFESWYGEDLVFAPEASTPSPRGIEGFSHVNLDAGSLRPTDTSADTPVLTYTLYNEPAYRHIRTHHLYLQSALRRFRDASFKNERSPETLSVPAFPRQAMILKTAWWPVARRGLTPLPVWDADSNPARRGGNDYSSWTRLVAVDPSLQTGAGTPVATEFFGTSIPAARRVGLRSFYHVTVTPDLAARLARDATAAKLAAIVLGRPIRQGDFLLMVGANVATKEIDDWVWATLWWHDRNAVGRYAAERPDTIGSVWKHYLMQVAFDSVLPTESDGSPHTCFNPWFEGRFPDGGQGGGTSSNCQTCHRRASYPAVSFLPVTRGLPDLSHDPAFAATQLRTNFNWALALHARP